LFPASLPSGLPQNPNVLLIRTHPNPFPSVANKYYQTRNKEQYVHTLSGGGRFWNGLSSVVRYTV
jgi:hypothetical protein